MNMIDPIKLNERFNLNYLKNNQSGFIAAEFLFSFIVVVACGILMFGLTFSLTTIEISQYITWSAARNFAVGNMDEDTSRSSAIMKYNSIAKAFPLLTGHGSENPWFELSKSEEIKIGDLASDVQAPQNGNNLDGGSQVRHPWYGVRTSIDLKLFKSLKVPFLGKVTNSPDDFVFPVRAFILRQPSVTECQNFFNKKFTEGIQKIIGTNWNKLGDPSKYVPHEDNGC